MRSTKNPKVKGYPPLQFVDSQRLPAAPPQPLPKLKRKKIVQASGNRNDIMDLQAWVHVDSQLKTDPPVKLPAVRKPRTNKPGPRLAYGMAKVRKHKPGDFWDNMSQKNMVEGNSSAEDINPEKIDGQSSDRQPRKSPRKKLNVNRTAKLPRATEKVHSLDKPLPVVELSPVQVTPVKRDTRKGKGIRMSQPPPLSVQHSLENVSPSGSPTASTDYRTTGTANDSFQDDGLDACAEVDNSLHLSEDERVNQSEAPQHEDVQRSAEKIASALTQLHVIVTPIRATTRDNILAEDTPEYRSGRITCSYDEMGT